MSAWTVWKLIGLALLLFWASVGVTLYLLLS